MAFPTKKKLVMALVLAAVNQSGALDNGLVRTPPMGWNSWNAFACGVSETLVKEMADAMVSSGMAAAGYQYVNIDDCWSANRRDGNGNLVVDAAKFPNGMKALAAYVHSKGLKLGIYNDRGTLTCAGYPGGQGYEVQDAATYASWDIDYLKYDNCYASLDKQTQYTTMGNALAGCGRPIVYSICSWSFESWMPPIGNLWRTTDDISANWGSIVDIIDKNAGLAQYAKPGAWNDPDMLEVGNGGLTEAENRAHFSIWCIMAAPLIAGNDLRSMNTNTKTVLTNSEVIAVDQDSMGFHGRRVIDNGDQEVWVKQMSDSSRVVVLFNRGSAAATISFTWADAWLPTGEPCTARNLWTHQSLGSLTGSYSTSVPSHDVVMLRLLRGPDQAPPVVSSVYVMSNTVSITFSEPVEQATAQNAANYAIDNGVSIGAAVLQADPTTVNLTVSALAKGTNYTVTLNNIRDRAPAPNTIVANTKATFQLYDGISKIRYYPRTGWASRMAGGVFEGTNGDQATGPYTTIYTIPAAPPEGQWTEVSSSSFSNAQSFQCIRYRTPDDGWCNVSEIEFYVGSIKMQGTVFGSPGSYNNSGDDYTKAFDGQAGTFMDYSWGNGGFTGMCLGGAVIVRSAMANSAGLLRVSVMAGAPTRIEFAGFPAGRAARIEILDLRGTVIRSLRMSSVNTAGFTIDACNDAGRPLSTGWYAVRIATEGMVISRAVNILR